MGVFFLAEVGAVEGADGFEDFMFFREAIIAGIAEKARYFIHHRGTEGTEDGSVER